MAEQILSMQSELPNAANQTEARKNIIRQKEEYEQLQLDLMRKSTDFGDYTRYLSVKWQDVQKHLHGNSIAIEFALIDDELLAPDKHLACFRTSSGRRVSHRNQVNESEIAIERDTIAYCFHHNRKRGTFLESAG